MKKWKDVPCYKGIQASLYGEIRNKKTGKILRSLSNERGYQVISFQENGIVKRCFVHRIVATTFIPNPNNRDVVHHKDNNPKNNKATNLSWVTTKENIHYQSRSQFNFVIYKQGKLYKSFDTQNEMIKELGWKQSKLKKFIDLVGENKESSYSRLKHFDKSYKPGIPKNNKVIFDWINQLSDSEKEQLKYDMKNMTHRGFKSKYKRDKRAKGLAESIM